MMTFLTVDPNLRFPDNDGKLMADSTEQYRWIVIIRENLEQRTKQAESVLEQGRRRAEWLASYLRSLGVDPDNFP